MILLGSELPSKATIFYRESTDDSNILRIPIESCKALNKPEQANERRSKLPQTEAGRE
jgi:hypothetical protein